MYVYIYIYIYIYIYTRIGSGAGAKAASTPKAQRAARGLGVSTLPYLNKSYMYVLYTHIHIV